MRKQAGRIVWLAMLGIISLLTSCATQVADLRQSPDFTNQAIISSGIVMGGYAAPRIDIKEALGSAIFSGGKVSLPKDLIDASVAERISDTLADSIKASRKDYPIIKTGVLIQKMGREEYLEFINEFFKTRKPGDKWMEKIRGLNVGGRYLAMAREEQNNEKQVVHKKDAPKIDKNAPGARRDGNELTLETIREIKATLTIYDLESGLEVWNGKTGGSKSYTSLNKVHVGPSSLGVTLNSGNLIGKKKSAQTLEGDVLIRIFDVFAESLPK